MWTRPDRDLFSTLHLGPYLLPNRVLMAPLTRNRAGEGNVPVPLNAEYYAQRASAGLIITEAYFRNIFFRNTNTMVDN